MTSIAQRRIVSFGVFEADLDNRQLTKSGYRIRLQDKPFQVLALLLERQGMVVTREELKETLWPADTFVEFDVGLNTAIKKLRAALSDAADNPRFVATVPRVGYRFLLTVSTVELSIAVEGKTNAQAPTTNAEPGEPTDSPALSLNPRAETSHTWVRSALLSRLGFFQWSAVALVIILAMGAGIKLLVKRTVPPLDPGAIQAIAVLPLQNMSTDPAQEYIADGMTDEIITDLAKLAGPKVISRTSAMQYKNARKTIPEIARELNVGAVVEGSVERSGNRMRIRVQLIQASTDQHLWAEAYDRQLSDVLKLEADLAQDISREIQLHLTVQQRQTMADARTLNPNAFQDYLQGRHYWAMRTEEGLAKAIEYFSRAIQEDPGDARSYAGLADCYIVQPMLTQAKEEETGQKARQAAQKALSLDDSLAEAHLAIAEIDFYQDWNFVAAEKEFRRTLELNPNNATGHQWYGEFLSVFGRHEEGIRELETAVALDPLSAIVHHQAGQTLQQARLYDQAIREYQQALKLNPGLYVSYEAMYWAYRRQGKFEAASQAMQGASPYWQASQGMNVLIEQLSSAYARGGKTGFLRQSVEMHRHFRDKWYLARDYIDLGEKERALQQLGQIFKSRKALELWILNDVEFDAIRSDPRFQSLVMIIESHKS
jgi:TolB-like protein/DNA-binding winged helix-turn-helix (wHTH) protein/Tfp pilus assembly protein PilF